MLFEFLIGVLIILVFGILFILIGASKSAKRLQTLDAKSIERERMEWIESNYERLSRKNTSQIDSQTEGK